MTRAVDRVLYSPERLVAIAKEAIKENSPFSVEDRIGLVYDGLALARAGYLNVSGVLTLYDVLREEKECEFRIVQQIRRASDSVQSLSGVASVIVSRLSLPHGMSTRRLCRS